MKNHGWTALELLIVLLILGIMAGLGIARFHEMRAMLALQATAQVLVADLSSLRGRAISLNQPLSLRITEDGEGYGAGPRTGTPERWVRLPEGIRFTGAPSRPITFYSRANAVPAGSLVLTSSTAGSVRVVVAPFGRIRWEWLP